MVRVTVLVAVYNAERWLQACLDSLLAQTLEDIQVVCIDDASTDNSLAMLQQYALHDPRIEVLHLEENMGQAHARNVGLSVAKGEFTCMVDADDWLSPDALELASRAMTDEVDCVLFEVVMSYGKDEHTYALPAFTRLTGSEAFTLSLDWRLHGLYLIRTELHRLHPYDESCRLYSDDNTTRIHYLCSRQVGRCAGRYYYRQHPASSTHRVSVRRFDYLQANASMRRQMEELGVGDELLAEYEQCRWLNLVDVYMFYHVHGAELTSRERRYGLEQLHHAWATIDHGVLRPQTASKLGYRPCRWWWLFRLQEWVYFSLRSLVGKNK